jgi:hypothetical protein
MLFTSVVMTFMITGTLLGQQDSSAIYLRVNQIGYLPEDSKIAIAFAHRSLEGESFELVNPETGEETWGPRSIGPSVGAFGQFQFHHTLDFSGVRNADWVSVRISGTSFQSIPFKIAPDAYQGVPDKLLYYMRHNRCGYNPVLDAVCHSHDGRTAYGPMPDGTYVDARGGWHDAGDQLRYLLTSSYAVGCMLLSYLEHPDAFSDQVNALGQPGANGRADILDEARWGLDWMLRMHPEPDQLFHQVADDRDHIGWRLPQHDTSDYGWGPGLYRVVYYASGEPQGLGEYQNTSTGVANLAGRYAAAMSLAAQIWETECQDSGFAETCLEAGMEVYAMGKAQPGCQEGTPCRAPYRYEESTWADDMEWGAAELFRCTGDSSYLHDAMQFADLIGTTSWMGADTAGHYELFPFVNIGHYALYSLVDAEFQDKLAGYYRTNIEAVLDRADNPYEMGVPFIWCSSNLVTAMVNHCLLYERMTGDRTYHSFMIANRDWLLGRNPWGISHFVGVPEHGNTPLYPHDPIAHLADMEITGGLIDGPVYGSIFNQLKGLVLERPDTYAPFQSERVVYHDDRGDYSTNEPIMDGTANATLFMSGMTRPRR